MSSSPDQRLADLEAGESEPLTNGPSTTPTRSIYSMTKDEIAKNIANRFVHSQTYIIIYLAMAALSITTVVLSLVNDCPTLPFYILEFIINAAMIVEVGIRFVAFGRQFWRSVWNIMDLVITAFCGITLLFILFSGCDNTSKEEELLDTLLLVVRNILQFGRLATVMRQYVLFLMPTSPPTLDPDQRPARCVPELRSTALPLSPAADEPPFPIDLSAPRRRGFTMDIDMEDEEDAGELARPLMRSDVVFDAGEERLQRAPMTDMPRAVQAAQDRDEEDMWASLG
ncbi:hypothetical protein LXA43DRAFT_1096987 [Ganoderma leucocontextum]|nr:hypothetical protein LXA43DRAFT_1096987 [Ganoderma leucocontextum]